MGFPLWWLLQHTGSSQTRNRTCVFFIGRQSLYHWANEEAQGSCHLRSSLSSWGASWWSWKRGSVCFLWGEPPSMRNRRWEEQGWSTLPPPSLFSFSRWGSFFSVSTGKMLHVLSEHNCCVPCLFVAHCEMVTKCDALHHITSHLPESSLFLSSSPCFLLGISL